MPSRLARPFSLSTACRRGALVPRIAKLRGETTPRPLRPRELRKACATLARARSAQTKHKDKDLILRDHLWCGRVSTAVCDDAYTPGGAHTLLLHTNGGGWKRVFDKQNAISSPTRPLTSRIVGSGSGEALWVDGPNGSDCVSFGDAAADQAPLLKRFGRFVRPFSALETPWWEWGHSTRGPRSYNEHIIQKLSLLLPHHGALDINNVDDVVSTERSGE